MREPGPGLVHRRYARRRAVGVSAILDRAPQLPWREAEAASSRNEAEASPYQVTERIGVDAARLSQAQAITDVADVRLNAQLVDRLQIEVCADRELPVPVPVHDAHVVIVDGREIVSIGVSPTTDRHLVALVVAVREDRSLPLSDLILVQVEARRLLGHRIDVPQLASATLGILQPVRALTRAEVPLRHSGPPSLGDDLHDAVRSFGAVERRRGGTLDDLDRLDVLGRDVVEPARAGATALRWTKRHIGIHIDGVDLDDCICV